MEFLALLSNPARAKAYDPSRMVSHELLERLMHAAALAPCCVAGLPCWHVEVVRTEEGKQRLGNVFTQAPHLTQAPLVLVFCADTGKAKAAAMPPLERAGWADAVAAATTVRLAAVDTGLAVDWIAEFDPAKLRAVLDLSVALEPIVALALGFEH